MTGVFGDNRVTGADRVRRLAPAALAVLCAAQFMDVMDFSIVNVALPAVQRGFHAPGPELQWVISGYALTYGGFLLAGARVADLFGRRRMFMAGLALFSLASLAGGAAVSMGMLIAARALQGVGAALVSPAALSLVTTVVTGDDSRRRALSALAAAGSAAIAGGVVLGGVLTALLSWRAVLLVNVPVGIVTVSLARRVLPEAREPAAPRLDLTGAVTATAGFLALVFGLTRAQGAGWTSALVILPLAAAAVLLAGFVVVEHRRRDALVPLRLFRLPALAGGNAVMLLASAAFYPMFVLTSQYMQQVLGYSPLQAGLAFVPQSLATAVCSGVLSARLAVAFGIRLVLAGGMLAMTAGLLILAAVPPAGSFAAEVLPGTLIVAAGIGTSFTAMLSAGTAGVPVGDQGSAAGLITSSQQIGGALGAAGLLTLAAARTAAVPGPRAHALLAGYHDGFRGAMICTLAAAIIALCALPGKDAA